MHVVITTKYCFVDCIRLHYRILIYGGKSLDDDEILDDLLELDVKNRALEECAVR